MNFMKDNRPFPNRRRKQTINFFQTVREGKRSFTTVPNKAEENCGLTEPWLCGRRFIQPSRKVTSCSRAGTDVQTILSTLDHRSNLCSSTAEEKFENLFSLSSESVRKKRKSFSINDSWTFFDRHNGNETSGSSQPVQTSNGSQGMPTSHLPASSPLFECLGASAQGSGEQCQPPSISNCGTFNRAKFLCNSTEQTISAHRNDSKKRPFFDLDYTMSSNTFKEESFFKVATANNDPESFKEGLSAIPAVSSNLAHMRLSTESFFKTSRLHHKTQTSFLEGGFFKEAVRHPQKLNSNEEFFMKPTIDSHKSVPNEGFFKVPENPLECSSSNEKCFKATTMAGLCKATKAGPSKSSQKFIQKPVPDKPTSHEGFFDIQPQNSFSNEGFFKTPTILSKVKRTSNEGYFNGSATQTEKPRSHKKTFMIPTMPQEKKNSKEVLFNIPKTQPEKPPSTGEFFMASMMTSEKLTSNQGFFSMQPHNSISNENFFQTFNATSIQPQNLTSNSFFLKTPTKRSNDMSTSKTFFKIPVIQSQKPLSNERLLKTPERQPQKSPSYEEYLKPHLNPQAFGTNKGFARVPGPDPSSSDKYECLFSTPSGVASLPRMTTPHLFQPFEKPPSRTTATSTSKTASRTTSKTANNSNEDSSYYVMSVTEGRGCAVCEIGFAAMDLKHPKLILSQFSDVPTYRKLLTKINLLNVAEILMPETFRNTNPSEMYKKIAETFPDLWLTTAKRVQFSAKSGLESVRKLMLPDDSSIEVIIYKKYYTLAATEALLRYVEVKHGILFSPKTLKVSFESAQDIVAIDFETCQRLELVTSSASVLFPEKYSLFGMLNCTKTMGGKRRLRSSLMQPSCSQELLEARLGSVSALVHSQQTLTSLQTCLLKFSSVERLLWLCRRTPNFKNESKSFDILTNYILLLKGSLESVPHLRKVLEEIDDDLIVNIRNELYDDDYELMLIHIKKMIREDARLAKGYAASSRERCFAINEGVNDLLDLARATYSELIEQVLKMVTELGEEYNLPLKMTQTADMGFHASYVLPKRMSIKNENVPDIFTEIKTKNRTVHLLTDEMFNLNVRINRAMEEIQLITNVVIYDLVESLKEGMSCLYRLCDHVAHLDLLSSLAQVSSTPDYVRPVFGSQTCLIGARHPIMDFLCPSKPIPNNIIASKQSNFTIITGPNMSGKTVYALTAPLIQIMAQVGCFVPADKAELRITDHIYLRKGGMDNMQCRLSSHGMEMKELSYTLKILTSRSLIILDELCTNSTCTRGICLAWAFCEEFLKEPAFTYLTTHYHYLCNLSKIYKNVKNFHMEAIERTPSPGDISCNLTFTYRLLPGITQMTNYALKLMMASALPDEVKQYAWAVAEDLTRRREASLPVCVVDDPITAKEMAKIEKLENFMFNLKALCKTDKFTPNMVRTLQKMVREEILSDIESDDEISDENTEKLPGVNEEHTSLTTKEGVHKIGKQAYNQYIKRNERKRDGAFQQMEENEGYSELDIGQLLEEDEQPGINDGDGDKGCEDNNTKYSENEGSAKFPALYHNPLFHDEDQFTADEDGGNEECVETNVEYPDSMSSDDLVSNEDKTMFDDNQEHIDKDTKNLPKQDSFNKVKEGYREFRGFVIEEQSQSSDDAESTVSEECDRIKERNSVAPAGASSA